jgi:serralysin
MVKLQIKLNASKAKLGSLMLSSIGLFALASEASAADAVHAPVGYVLANDIANVASVTLNPDGSLLMSMTDGSEAILPAGTFAVNNGQVYVEANIADDLSPYMISDSGGSILMVAGAFAAIGGLVALSSSDGEPDNVAPVFSSGTTGSLAENATGTAYSASASDGNGDAISYTLSGADAALFNIDTSSGAVTFRSAPDFETPADAGGDNVYNITVSASDGVLSTSQSVVITVTNENDNGPLLTSATTATVSENETNIGYTTTATDADGDTLTYTITGGADAALFVIDSATGALSFAAGQDFEAPADGNADNQYEVVIQVSDGTLTDDQTVTVTVTNANDNAPVFTSSATVSLAENTTATGYAANTTDADGGAATYSITGGADASLFSVDATTGTLSFIAAPDFDVPEDANADNVFDVVVTANDGVNATSQTVAVTLTNVNDNSPVFTSSAVLAFDENGTASPFSVAAADGDSDTLTYSISGGADAARFTIDSATGAVSFVNSPDFESPADAGGNNTYDIIVRADDGMFQSNQAVAISINNLNDNAPVIAGGAATVAENSSATGFTATATDADGNAVTFSISGGADAALFSIDASTGVLSFIAAPDFDQAGDAGADNVYDVNVQASDGLAADTAAVAITVTNLNDEIPVFTSAAAVSVDENLTATGYVGSATDGDGDTLTFSISGGVDSALFTINSATGALSFIAEPDFENPGDVGADNSYNVDVTVSDGVNMATQSVTIAVTDVVAEAPVFSSGVAGSIAENSTAAAYTAVAVDPNGNPVTYSISGGADAAQFTINASTGDVQLITASDFENPGDAGADNVYDI